MLYSVALILLHSRWAHCMYTYTPSLLDASFPSGSRAPCAMYQVPSCYADTCISPNLLCCPLPLVFTHLFSMSVSIFAHSKVHICTISLDSTYGWYLIVVFIAFSNNYWCWGSFLMPVGHLLCCFWRNDSLGFALIFWLVVFLILSSTSCLYILEIEWVLNYALFQCFGRSCVELECFFLRCLLEYTSETIKNLVFFVEENRKFLFLYEYKAVFVTSLAVQCLRSPCFHCREYKFDPWLGRQDHAFLTIWPKKKNRAVHVVTKSWMSFHSLCLSRELFPFILNLLNLLA